MEKKTKSTENQKVKKPTVFQAIVETWIEAHKAKESIGELTEVFHALIKRQDELNENVKKLSEKIDNLQKGGSNAN